MVGIGDLPGGTISAAANNVSANGSVIVGTSRSSNGQEAFRWTQSGGMVGLGDLPGGSFSSNAWATSADGSIIIGNAQAGDGQHAFIWTSSLGMVDLKQYLVGLGVTGLDNWALTQAYAMSADGGAITGLGINPNGQTEAWLVTNLVVVPEPGTIVLAGVAMVCMMLAVRKSRVEN
jgi:probable HAF family extracellular repeat protein